ncbi:MULTISPECIES: PLDc N-terminal domain-containing protein [Bacteria]|uniref:PLD nuclease N-terminal domain-containing protein n=1 Tax=Bacteria TaxID=2 RepID=UPI003C7EBE1A
MARFLVIGGFLAAVFWIFSIVDCSLQPATRHRGVSKGAWVAIVVLIPVIGGILWFAIGRSRGERSGPEGLVPLDDDPARLRRVSEAEQDRRIRELEEELARLDDPREGDAPGDRS